MSIWTEFELNTMHANANIRDLCFGKYRKIATQHSNWELYYKPQTKGVYAIAKDGSGAIDCCYGNMQYIATQVREGIIKKSELTKYGRRLLRAYNV